jgi:hypothetical protein
MANVNFTFGRHLKLVDLDWTSFENCNGKFNGIDNIEIFRMSGFNCADINLNMIHSFKQLRSLQSRAANLGLGLEKDVSGQFLVYPTLSAGNEIQLQSMCVGALFITKSLKIPKR